ncbi:MAG: TolC family protein [Gemmataceae bacterium]
MVRSRWTKRFIGGVIAMAAATGCTKQVFREPSDFDQPVKAGIPAQLESNPQAPITPYLQLDPKAAPATVLDTNRKAVNISLQECFLMALKQGNVGQQGGLLNPGFTNTNIGTFTGRGVTGTDSIAAIAYDPSVTYLDIERSLSKFDARVTTSATWNKLDAPTAAQFTQFQNQQDQMSLSTTLSKALPTGGVAGITTSMSYSKFSNVPSNLGTFVNPNYTPTVQFIFEQPLLQSFGVQINEIASNHPGSLLIPSLRPTGQGTEGILIARIRYDQQRAEFDRLINSMLYNVETAYWDLYAAYYNLYAQEEVLKRSTYLLYIVKQRVEVAGSLRKQQLHETTTQYFTFKQSVIQAKQTVLTTESRLRGLLGMRSDDGTRLIPSDVPKISEIVPDYYEACMDAVAFRPELIQSRYDLKALQLNLMLQKNLRQPDLRFFSSYNISGLGTTLDGSTDQNALHSLRTNQFNSLQLGLRYDMPFGFRDANALVRQANTQLYRSASALLDGERKAVEDIGSAVRNIAFASEMARLTKTTREESEKTIIFNLMILDSGAWDVPFLNQLLIDQQNYARSISDEYKWVAEYSKALAGLEWARGTIQRYNNVTIAEGELPEHVKKKALDHMQARESALKLREHPAEFALPPLSVYERGIQNGPAPAAAQPSADPKALPNSMPMPVPGGAVPAPSKVTQWPGDKPSPMVPTTSGVTPVSVPPTGNSLSSPITPAAPTTSMSPAPSTIPSVRTDAVPTTGIPTTGDVTFKQTGTLKFEKSDVQIFPKSAGSTPPLPSNVP